MWKLFSSILDKKCTMGETHVRMPTQAFVLRQDAHTHDVSVSLVIPKSPLFVQQISAAALFFRQFVRDLEGTFWDHQK